MMNKIIIINNYNHFNSKRSIENINLAQKNHSLNNKLYF